MNDSSQNLPYILVVGSGNGEYILKPEQDLELGKKHLVEATSLIGGSGINYTLRLMKAGFPVLPILPIGRDALGHQIQAELLREAVASQMPAIVTEWLESE
ncbi:MAG: hypothetical protein ACRC8A_19400, partial [Microcoleaceae cyanobacterium]